MDPRLLAELLGVMRQHNVASARVVAEGVELAVTFEPQMAPMPGDKPEQGGWKSPQHLDNPLPDSEEEGRRL